MYISCMLANWSIKKGMMETILQDKGRVESLSLEEFNNWVDVVLRDMV